MANKEFHDPVLKNCANHYTEHSIYDLFMESEEDVQRCTGCPNLLYITGTMTCKYLDTTRREKL